MKQTFLLRTTGFDRSDVDVGFELFAIKLDGSDINKLLMLVDEAKRIAKFHPRFSFLVLKSDQGHWVSKEDLPSNTLQRMQISHDSDTNLILRTDSLVDGWIHTISHDLFVKPAAVFWGCNLHADEGDWLVATLEFSEEKLRRLALRMQQPDAIFK